MTDKRKRTVRTRQRAHEWKPRFLAAFAETRLVSKACDQVGIGRTTAYEARDADPDFAAAWEDVEQRMIEEMEREAYRRAVEGVSKPLVSAGKHVTDVTEYSDGLLMFLLKARRPTTYRENVKVEHTGSNGGPIAVQVAPDPDRATEVARMLQDQGAVPKP